MDTITLSLPEETLLALGASPQDASAAVRMAAAAKLYELGRLSSDAAALLAGVPRVVFLARLADWGGITFLQGEDELRQDLANA